MSKSIAEDVVVEEALVSKMKAEHFTIENVDTGMVRCNCGRWNDESPDRWDDHLIRAALAAIVGLIRAEPIESIGMQDDKK